MRKRFKHLLENRFLPSWLVLMADFTIMVCTFLFIYFLRFNLFAQYADVPVMVSQLIAVLPFFLLAAFVFKPHQGILRHSTMHDALTLVKAHLVLSGGFFLVSWLGRSFNSSFVIPVSVIIVHYFVSVFLMVFMRFMVQVVYHNLLEKPKDTISVLIYGAGKMGSIARSVIVKDDNIHYKIVGYVDDNPRLWNSTIGGVKVFSPKKAFEHAEKEGDIKEVVLAISPAKIAIERKREIVDLCLANHIKVREVPDPSTWLDGQFGNDQIRSIRIEDLLGRDPISLKVESLSKGLEDKRVMVTGGAGSIGSEIVRQLAYFKPESIIIVDQSESAVFEIKNEILPLLNGTELLVFVADVTDHFKMRKIFNRCNPDVIYHAAAYKHVPLMELQPYEAISNNVGGTKNLADLAVEFGVTKFVMISTDKAVNPSNIMGATKRICEIYIQSLSQQKGIKTQFITTRFGNVLGSNGSVIPLFKKQISQGGPVTLTHRDIIRYFMTIPEACQLVMEAGFMGNGGEIFLFDMGKPIRIYDLAEKMISLSGFIPHKEIEILEIGLRPGEKLYEELLADAEETMPTSNKKIMIGKIRPYPYKQMLYLIDRLIKTLSNLSDMEIVAQMKDIVPEFVSCNSRFEVLDFAEEDQKAG